MRRWYFVGIVPAKYSPRLPAFFQQFTVDLDSLSMRASSASFPLASLFATISKGVIVKIARSISRLKGWRDLSEIDKSAY